MEDLDLLSEINKLFKQTSTLIHRTNFGDDLDDAYEWKFYVQELNKKPNRIGQLLFKRVGSYQVGKYFEDKGFSLYEKEDIRKCYPVEENRAAYHSIGIVYRECRFDHRNDAFSSTPFSRWWISDWDILKDKYPQESKQISKLVLSEIKQLAETANLREYKSGWVYHRFLEKVSQFEDQINNNILADTCFYFSPTIFYNHFSPKVVKFSKKEIEEHNRNILMDF